MNERSRVVARVALVAGAVFIVLLAVLHALRPDLAPTWRFISEYERGDYGWLMRAAFFSLALSCAATCLALRAYVRTLGGYLGLLLLALSAVGMVMAGIFETDPINIPPDARTTSGRLHEIGAMLDGIPLAAPLISFSLARTEAFRFLRPTLLWTAWLPLLGTAVFIASLVLMMPRDGSFGPEVLVGIPNRMMILAHAAWLMLVAGCIVGLPRPESHPLRAE